MEYRGADMQWKLKTKWGNPELRGEYWFGNQTAYANIPLKHRAHW